MSWRFSDIEPLITLLNEMTLRVGFFKKKEKLIIVLRVCVTLVYVYVRLVYRRILSLFGHVPMLNERINFLFFYTTPLLFYCVTVILHRVSLRVV